MLATNAKKLRVKIYPDILTAQMFYYRKISSYI